MGFLDHIFHNDHDKNKQRSRSKSKSKIPISNNDIHQSQLSKPISFKKSISISSLSRVLDCPQEIDVAFRKLKVELRRVLQVCYIALGILMKSDETSYHLLTKTDENVESERTFHVETAYMIWEEILDVKGLINFETSGDVNQERKDNNSRNVAKTEKWKYIVSDMERELLVEEAEMHRTKKLGGTKFNSSEEAAETYVYDFIREKLVQLGLLIVVKRTLVARLYSGINNTSDITAASIKSGITTDDDQKIVWFKEYDKLNDWFLQNTFLTPDVIFQSNRKVEYFKVNREVCSNYANDKCKPLRIPKWFKQLNFTMVIALCKKLAAMESYFEYDPKTLICSACSPNAKKWLAHDFSKLYALKMLPSHLLRNHDLEHFIVLVTCPVFVHMRLSVLGIQMAVKRFILDCQSFNHDLKNDFINKSVEYENVVSDAYELIKTCLEHYTDETTYTEVAFALRSIGNSLTKMDKTSKAFDFYAQGLKYAKNDEPWDRSVVSDLLQIMANIYLTKGQYEKGLQSYEEAIEIEKSYPTKDVDVIVRILDKIGLIYGVLSETDRAIKVMEESLILNKLRSGDKTMAVAKMLHKLALLLSSKKNFDKAVQCNTEAEMIATSQQGTVDKLFLIKVYSSLGKLYMRMKDNEHALKCFNQLLNVDENNAKIDFAQTYDLMGSLYCELEMYTEAISSFNKELDHLKNRRKTPVKTIHAKRCLAYALKKNKQYEEAVLIYKQVILFFKGKPQMQADVARCLSDLGSCYKNMNKWLQAIDVLNESLDIRRNLPSDNNAVRQVDIAYNLHNLGDVLVIVESYDRALKHFLEALDIRGVSVGEDTAETLNCVGVVYFKLGEDDTAMSYFRKALHYRILLFGDHHEKVADTLQNMACVHKNYLELDLAMIKYERAHKIRLKFFGNAHEKVAASLYDVAIVKALMGEIKASLNAFEKVLYIYRELGCNDDVPHVKNILTWVTFLQKQLVNKILCDSC